MTSLYPLKFSPIFKDKIWGGQKIKTILGKDFSPLPNCGETWELSGVKGNVSVARNGSLKGSLLTDLIQQYGEELLGKKIIQKYGPEFPLLVKFIDANDDLSVQVHPDDKLAKERHDSFGKTEMWYIMQADEGSSLITGFNRKMDKDSYVSHFNNGQLMDILNTEKAQSGDVFFIPAGRVHTIGKGLLLAEIQQTSDVTYRIYDFDRVDDQGNQRELHVEEALDAIDYQFYDAYKTSYKEPGEGKTELVRCPYFVTNKIHISDTYHVDHKSLDCFKIYVILEGTGSIQFGSDEISFQKGEVILVPATLKDYTFETTGDVTMLESYID
ncbi:MAG: type I phosphomannose isomerase catalytic subunit [Bacteroidota bacterium]